MGNSPARMRNNEASLCTSETRVTVSQKLTRLRYKQPTELEGDKARQRERENKVGDGVVSIHQFVYDKKSNEF